MRRALRVTRAPRRGAWLRRQVSPRAGRRQRPPCSCYTTRGKNGRRPRGRTVLLLRVMRACSLARSPTMWERVDLHHRGPLKAPHLQCGVFASLLRSRKVFRPGACAPPTPIPTGCVAFYALAECWGFLSESHRPHAAYDTAASAARPRNRKMWTAPHELIPRKWSTSAVSHRAGRGFANRRVHWLPRRARKGFGRIQVARREKTSLASALDVHPVIGGAFRFRAGLCPSSAGRHH